MYGPTDTRPVDDLLPGDKVWVDGRWATIIQRSYNSATKLWTIVGHDRTRHYAMQGSCPWLSIRLQVPRLPTDLASVLRDQSVIIPQDAAVFELIAGESTDAGSPWMVLGRHGAPQPAQPPTRDAGRRQQAGGSAQRGR